ncbi:MAG TPA: UDP-N-acetylmuramoyl-tripeptide--D-alanyl-D-alanine ligase [Terriglobales bacterium]|nr:UDP-N-acetylmuramoyl-tripeptide--D-alanyl-D-alanine ligase [Terriglobales bacterium]
MRHSLARIAEFIQAKGEFQPELTASGYSIDSRTIQPGDLFFAVIGERLDGHHYVEAALRAGAVAAVVRQDRVARFADRRGLLVVDDTLVALQNLGFATRRVWGKPLIAVTGSAGKTTTKEAIAHLLGKKKRVLKSAGNLNNHFGLPLQLLRLEPEHEVAVIELGMSHPGEIAALTKICRPDVGVVTCVAPVHLEGFDSIKGIAKAKYELIEGLHAGTTAILNADDEYVSQFGRDFHGKVVMFGIRKPADVCAQDVRHHGSEGSSFTLMVEGTREEVRLPLLGQHNILNALAATATALQYGLTPSECARALEELRPADKRGEMIQLAGATIINDCYNSNPAALKSMVDALVSLPARRRIVVAGEMLELGPAAEALHRECGAYMEAKVDLLLGVRGMARHMVDEAEKVGMYAEFVESPEAAAEFLATEIRSGDALLFKASRGVKLEKALENLRAKLAG